jgi:hypothetical protein
VTTQDEAMVETLARSVREYAVHRSRDVARGLETPRLAALLLQKYGAGIVDAVATIFDSRRAADPIQRALDEETIAIDPLWREHDRERWNARPADIALPAGDKP